MKRLLLLTILLAVGLCFAQQGSWSPGVDSKTLQGQDTLALRLLTNNQPGHATAWGDSVLSMAGDAANCKLVTDYFRIQDTLVSGAPDGGWVYLFTIPVADTVAVTWCQLWLDSVSVTGEGNDAAMSFSVGDSNLTADPVLSGAEINWILSTASNATLSLGYTTPAMSGTYLLTGGVYLPFSMVTVANKVYANWGGAPAADGRIGLRGRLLMGFRSDKIGAW